MKMNRRLQRVGTRKRCADGLW